MVIAWQSVGGSNLDPHELMKLSGNCQFRAVRFATVIDSDRDEATLRVLSPSCIYVDHNLWGAYLLTLNGLATICNVYCCEKDCLHGRAD